MVMLMLNSVSVKKFFPLGLCVCLFLACEGSGAVQSKHLNNKNVIKTIKSSDGDVFDCVDMYKQPSFDHPLLKDHKLQMKPSSEPKGLLDVKLPENLFPQFEEECPEGFIPIQRLEGNDFKGSDHSLGLRAPFLSTEASPNNFVGMKTAIAGRMTVEYPFGWLGGGAQFNVYGLPQVVPSQISSAGFWVVNFDSYNGSVLLTAGWMVNPAIYNDSQTRLSLVWTLNGTVANCYDLRCPGFFQINKKMYLGASIQPLSVYKGQQYAISVFIYKDVVTNNWWFSFGSPTNYVGYWPQASIPKGLDVAKQMLYGGYAACPANGTCPPMGNGDFPSNTSCYVNQVVRANQKMEMVGVLLTEEYEVATRSDCYRVGKYSQTVGQENYWFTFGGPACNH